MASFAQPRNPSRQLVGFAGVILLHLGIVYGLVHGLGRQAIEIIRQPLETKIIEELKPPPPDAAPPPLKLAPPPPPYIPPPEINIAAPVASANAIVAITTTKPVEPPPVVRAPPPADVVHLAPVIDAAKSCRQPEYPPVSRRNEETGTVVLQFLVDIDGKALDSKVESSSGYARLDSAARDALQLCQFKPGTADGKPERAWGRIRYTWRLQ